MTFRNAEIDLDSLPRAADVHFHELHPRYAPVVLGTTIAVGAPLFALALVFFLIAVIAKGIAAAFAALLVIAVVFAFPPWFAYKSARAIRYALREHDVIVRSGIFWKRETVQPIRRIQHIEQHQGPVDKRFGLYELKLFSAGTGYLTFRIPGLDAETASRIRQFILNVQEDGWAAEEPTGSDNSPANADKPAESTPAPTSAEEPASSALTPERGIQPAESENAATRADEPAVSAAARVDSHG